MNSSSIKQEFYNQFQPEDVVGDARLLVKELGIDTYKELLEKVPGVAFYIPKITHYKSVWKRLLQLPEINNMSTKELAVKLGVSETFINDVKVSIRLEKSQSKLF